MNKPFTLIVLVKRQDTYKNLFHLCLVEIERQYHMFKENQHIYDKYYYFEYEKERFLKMEQNKAFERLTTSQWNGIIGDLATGAADMSFAPLSVSKYDFVSFSSLRKKRQ